MQVALGTRGGLGGCARNEGFYELWAGVDGLVIAVIGAVAEGDSGEGKGCCLLDDIRV